MLHETAHHRRSWKHWKFNPKSTCGQSTINIARSTSDRWTVNYRELSQSVRIWTYFPNRSVFGFHAPYEIWTKHAKFLKICSNSTLCICIVKLDEYSKATYEELLSDKKQPKPKWLLINKNMYFQPILRDSI